MSDDGPHHPQTGHARRIARLSELSRRVMNAAEQTAVALDHPVVGIGHLLLVLAWETRSPTAHLLSEQGLDAARLHQSLLNGDANLMASIDQLLPRLAELVGQTGSHYTGTEHLLLALTADPNGRAMLEAYGVSADLLARRLVAR
ncbi:MAG: hypothetical protein CL610_13215 [Anaerolineaceae bacterium]|nr:hypothetical protein [Anaerolineaceae bacterium]